jgi:hypothetical protein
MCFAGIASATPTRSQMVRSALPGVGHISSICSGDDRRAFSRLAGRADEVGAAANCPAKSSTSAFSCVAAQNGSAMHG